MKVDSPITEIARLTKEQQKALKKLGLATVRDLLYHFPVRYEVPGKSGTIAALTSGAKVTLYGRFTKIEAKKLWKSRRAAGVGTFEDATGKVKVMWFNQPYMAKMTPINTMVQITGVVSGGASPYITNPEVAPLATSSIPESLFSDPQSETANDLFPVYPESQGITSRWFYHTIKKILAHENIKKIDDPLPPHVRAEYHLPENIAAFTYLHLPRTQKEVEVAKKRFAFEEVFALHVANEMERKTNEHERAFDVRVSREALNTFAKTLPFPLTGAQQRAIEEIAHDFEKPHPMARLLEGDVGSGKTAVAALTSYAVVTSRPKGKDFGTLQVAYMAPTEILAQQHFETFMELFRELPIAIGLITGSGCYKFPSKTNSAKATKISRAQLLKWVANGEVAMVVGTHALIQKSVAFKHLAYVIVDEQHRFGTKQRKALAHKGDASPHFLSMTATPIPRTLALTIYGDLDLSVLDELPKNRASIETEIVSKEKRTACYERVRVELEKGRQVYVICPRIDEPDPEKELALRAKSVTEEARRLKKEVFTEYEIGILHGKLTPAQKETEMKKFSQGKTHILVATSVVEVGVNVPNATVILIEGAERFGLSQLHQLRGRVLRSHHNAFCFLLPEKLSPVSMDRLRALEKTRNGFELAEQDLLLRGAGDLSGASQWGISDIGMEALKNPRLISLSREAAQKIVAEDPTLKRYPALHERIERAKNIHRE